MYISAPPIKFWQFRSAVLKVKDALDLQSLQMAESFLTLSQSGINSVMFFHGKRKKVPYKDETITIFLLLAALSANLTISVKN
jgi:hypothetical protein